MRALTRLGIRTLPREWLTAWLTSEGGEIQLS